MALLEGKTGGWWEGFTYPDLLWKLGQCELYIPSIEKTTYHDCLCVRKSILVEGEITKSRCCTIRSVEVKQMCSLGYLIRANIGRSAGAIR